MKAKHYLRLLAPLCIFGFAFRILEIIFAIEPQTGFYVNGSVIPTLFNVYVIIASLFLLSSIIFVKKETKPVRARLASFGKIESFVSLMSAVFFLSATMQQILLNIVSIKKYSSFTDVLKDLEIYEFVVAVLAALFLVHLSSSPKKAIKNKFYIVISLACPLFCLLRLLEIFTDLSQILSRAYGDYSIIFLAASALAYMNLSKIIAGNRARKYMVGFGMTAVFFGGIRLADLVMRILPNDPYNISLDILMGFADVFSALFILVIVIKVIRKPVAKAEETKKSEISEVLQ
ncbi:MAG: hypothetical protein ACI4N6_02575 [Eubacteriales bacterium]